MRTAYVLLISAGDRGVWSKEHVRHGREDIAKTTKQKQKEEDEEELATLKP